MDHPSASSSIFPPALRPSTQHHGSSIKEKKLYNNSHQNQWLSPPNVCLAVMNYKKKCFFRLLEDGTASNSQEARLSCSAGLKFSLLLFFFLYFICFWVLTVFTNVQKQSYKFYVHKIYLTQTYYTNKNTLHYTTRQKNRNKKKKEASLNCNE